MLNNNSSYATDIPACIIVDSPKIQISTVGQLSEASTESEMHVECTVLHFRRTSIGHSSQREMCLVNCSHVPLTYTLKMERQPGNAFAIDQIEGRLHPLDQTTHILTFSPDTEEHYNQE